MNDVNWCEPKGLILAFHLVIIIILPIVDFFSVQLLLGVLWFVIMFIIIGQSIRLTLFSRYKKLELKFPKSVSARFAFDIILSITITSLLTILLAPFYLLDVTLLLLWLFSFIFDIAFLIQERKGLKIVPNDFIDILRLQGPLLLSGMFAFVFMVWRYNTFSWPEAPGTDLFVHEGVARLILINNGSSVLISNYPYVFHALVALISQGSGLDIHILLGYGSFVTLPLIYMVTYSFFKNFLENSTNSLLCVVLMTFIVEGGALLAFYYIYPSSFAAVIFLLLLLFLNSTESSSLAITATCAGFIVLLLTYPNSILAVFPAVLFLNMCSYKTEIDLSRLMKRILIIGIGLGIFIISLFYAIGPLFGIYLSIISFGPISFQLYDGVGLSIALLVQGYGIFMIGFLVIGLLTLIRHQFSNVLYKVRYTNNDDFILYLVSFYLVVFFLPLEFTFRTEEFIRPLNSIVIFIGISVLVYYIKITIATMQNRFYSFLHFKKSEKDILVIGILISILVIPNAMHMNSIWQYEPHNPSSDELSAFLWLKYNVPENGYVLTDPATGFLMRSFITRNCSTSFIENERFPSPLRNTTLFQLVFNYFNASSDDDYLFQNEIQNNMGMISYIVVSPRSIAWFHQAQQNRSGLYVNYDERLNIHDSDLAKFDSSYYKLVKQFGKLLVLQRQEVISFYSDDFENGDYWISTSLEPPQIENGICYWEKSSNPSLWHHFYTNNVSFVNSDFQLVTLKIKSNSSTLNIRVFFYTGIDRNGTIGYSDFIRPGITESSTCIATIGFDSIGVRIACVSIGFFDSSSNWQIELDSISIIEISES